MASIYTSQIRRFRINTLENIFEVMGIGFQAALEEAGVDPLDREVEAYDIPHFRDKVQATLTKLEPYRGQAMGAGHIHKILEGILRVAHKAEAEGWPIFWNLYKP
jgi:hypothetical protein